MKLTVTIPSQGRLLEAALFIPPQNTKELAPAILFEGSMTGATLRLTEHLAEELSHEGFVCLVLDHSFYSEDETSALSWESPGKRVADIKAALEFLKQHATTDGDCVVGVGVSVGAEYLARAIRETNICKGFVMVQGTYDDAQNFIGEMDIPSTILNEQDLSVTADEISIWARALLNNPQGLYRPYDSADWRTSHR